MTDTSMHVALDDGTDRDSLVRLVDDVADLTAIFDPAVRAVLLRRDPSERERLGLAASRHPAVRETALQTVIDSGDDLTRAWRGAFGGDPDNDPILADCLFWQEVVRELTGAPRAGVRLQRLARAMCPYFHHDFVPLRLLVTYSGPTTEVVVDPRIDDLDLEATNDGGERTRRIEAAGLATMRPREGDVLVLRGHGWTGSGGRGAYHRSPSCDADTGRLILAIDPIGWPEED
jgi:hypothetical protein